MRRAAFIITFLSVLAAASTLGEAQRPAASFPVIVVFRGDASLAAHRGDYRSDERAAADPDAWGYLDHDVVGSVMALERRHVILLRAATPSIVALGSPLHNYQLPLPIARPRAGPAAGRLSKITSPRRIVLCTCPKTRIRSYGVTR